MLIFAQPLVLENLFKNVEFSAKGLCARFVYCYPESRIGSRNIESKSVNSNTQESYNFLIEKLLDNNDTKILTLSLEAYRVSIEFAQQLEPKLNIEIIEEQCNKKIRNIYNLLFWNYEKNTFITPCEVNLWLKRINKKYKISKEELTTHRLRHTALTYWKTLGIDLSVIQRLAGHVKGSNITEKVYIDIPEDYINKELTKVI